MTRCFYDEKYKVYSDNNNELFPFIMETEQRATISEADTVGSTIFEDGENKKIYLTQIADVVMSGNMNISDMVNHIDRQSSKETNKSGGFLTKIKSNGSVRHNTTTSLTPSK